MLRRSSIAIVAGLVLGVGSAEAAPQTRFSLANGCYALGVGSPQQLVAKSGDSYRASAGSVGSAEAFRMQATALGTYLLYGKAPDFLALVSDALGTQTRVAPAQRPSASADWEVRGTPGAFTISSVGQGKFLAVGGGGELRPGAAGEAAKFSFVPATGCAEYPEVEVNAVGEPGRGSPSYGEVVGTVDPHTHMMQFEAIGGTLWCGRVWHPYGAPNALVDCPDHEGNGGAVEAVFSGQPTHDTKGWPTFKDWPSHRSYTHQQLYYKWLERSWKGGLRVFLNLFNENEVLCNVYPYKRTPCNEMEGAKNQIRRIYELEDYIDAQNGGPGMGWFRIVKDPFEAREVINRGKLAVILGVETSKLFDCDVYNEVPECDRAQIDRGIAEMERLGVRALFPIHKFDNALGGVAFDDAPAGAAINAGNFQQTGRWWQIERCTGEEQDREQSSPPADVTLALKLFLPPGNAPVYGPGPHCNTKGLSALGEYLVRRMMATRMIIDPDHMSVRSRTETLSLAEAKGYSGVTSEHSWSTVQSYKRFYGVGGWVNPITSPTSSFIHDWRQMRALRSERYRYGMGYGSDVHGLHKQPAPRASAATDPLKYPFKSLDGKVTLHRQRSGQRVFDLNTDGVAHYGLYTDWIADMGKLAGPQFTEDMARGAESYLQMWERAYGIPGPRCRYSRGQLKARGLSWARVGSTPRQLLARAGQPQIRKRAWTYCVRGKHGRGKKVMAVFTTRGRVGFVASTGRGHEALHISPRSRARRLRGARKVGRNLYVRRLGRRRAVYGVRRGRVRFVAVTTRSIAKSRRQLRRYVKLAGL